MFPDALKSCVITYFMPSDQHRQRGTKAKSLHSCLARLSSPCQTGEACQLSPEEFPLQGRGDTLTLTLCVKSNPDTPLYLMWRFHSSILLSPFTNAFRGLFTRLIHQRIWEMFRLLCQVIKQREHYQNPFPGRPLSNFIF